MKVEFTGVYISGGLWEIKELSLREKFFLGGLPCLYTEDGGCAATNAEMADFFKLSERSISKIISSLAKKGYLTVTYDSGKRVIY